MENELMIKVDNVSKKYKLGQIGGTTLNAELQRLRAKIRHQEDPTRKIGAKDYNRGETFMALDGISFEVRKGERVGIIGKNGAGKSTLLKLLSRVTGPTSGEIGLNGRVASMLEVGTGFHPELTGRENIYMNGAILGMTKKEIDAKIEKIIDFSEVRQFIDTPVKRYSSGMYVKLAFSVAAHLDSEILIMDEVLAVGDQAFQKKCINKMNEVSKDDGKTILYVSHHMDTIKELCDRCIVLDHGKIVFDGDVEQGILEYLDCSKDKSVSIDYCEIPRKEWLENTKIKTLYACFNSAISNHFLRSQPIELTIGWENECNVQNVGLRIEIKDAISSPVASAVIRDFYSGTKGEKSEKSFLLDLSSLHEGYYRTVYVFFIVDEFGRDIVIDCVDGLSVEIFEDLHDISWESIHWGEIELPPIVVKE